MRGNSFHSDLHISFVPDAKDEPGHLHRVPTPVPSTEEVLQSWTDESIGNTATPPPLHVNDSLEERHMQRIVPGLHVAQEIETFMFGSFEAPVGNTVNGKLFSFSFPVTKT